MCGVHRSLDHGLTWESWADGMTNPNESDSFYVEELLCVPAGPWEGVFAATMGGIYHRAPGTDWIPTTPPNEFSYGVQVGDSGRAIPFSTLCLSPNGLTLYAAAGVSRPGANPPGAYPALPPYHRVYSGPDDQYTVCTLDLQNPTASWQWDPATVNLGAGRRFSAVSLGLVGSKILLVTHSGAYSLETGVWQTLDALTQNPLPHTDVRDLHLTARGVLYVLLGRNNGSDRGGLYRIDFLNPATSPWEWIGSPNQVLPDLTHTWTELNDDPYFKPEFLNVREGLQAGDADDLLVGVQYSTSKGGVYRTRLAPGDPPDSCDWYHHVYLEGSWGGGFTYHYLNDALQQQNLDVGWYDHDTIPPLCPLAVSPGDPDRMILHAGDRTFCTSDGGNTWSNAFCEPAGAGWTTRGAGLMVVISAAFRPDGTLFFTAADRGLFEAVEGTRDGFGWTTRELSQDSNAHFSSDDIWISEAGRVRLRQNYMGSGDEAVFAAFGEMINPAYRGSKIMCRWGTSNWRNITATWDTTDTTIYDFEFVDDETIVAACWHWNSSGRFDDVGARIGTSTDGVNWTWTAVNSGLENPQHPGEAGLRAHGRRLLHLPGTSRVLLASMHYYATPGNTAHGVGGNVNVRGGLFCLDTSAPPPIAWETWLHGDSDPRARGVRSLALDASGTVLYAGTNGHSGGTGSIGTVLKAVGPFTNPPAVWETLANETAPSYDFEENFYRNWAVGLELDQRMTHILSLAVSPLDPDRVYAGMNAARFDPRNGLWRYDPARDAWEHLAGNFNEGCATGIQVLEFDPVDPTTLLCGTDGEEWFAVAAEPLTLEVSDLTPGGKAQFETRFAHPGAAVYHLYSLHGDGPLTTPYGFILDLSVPVKLLGITVAGTHGDAVTKFTVPGSVPPGLSIWCQSVENDSGVFRVSNGVATAFR